LRGPAVKQLGLKNLVISAIRRTDQAARRTHSSPAVTPIFLIHVNETDANFRRRTGFFSASMGLSVNGTGDALGLWRTDKNASGNSPGEGKISICSAQ
jgi:hypothetical protein